jgi:hypothetical protein
VGMKSTDLYCYDDHCHDHEERGVGLVSFSANLICMPLFINSFYLKQRGRYSEQENSDSRSECFYCLRHISLSFSFIL